MAPIGSDKPAGGRPARWTAVAGVALIVAVVVAVAAAVALVAAARTGRMDLRWRPTVAALSLAGSWAARDCGIGRPGPRSTCSSSARSGCPCWCMRSCASPRTILHPDADTRWPEPAAVGCQRCACVVRTDFSERAALLAEDPETEPSGTIGRGNPAIGPSALFAKDRRSGADGPWREASNARLESMPVHRNVQSRPVPEALLTPAEVGALFRVDPKTVTRWAKAGKLSSIRTLGGHRRYRETEVRRLLRGVEAAE